MEMKELLGWIETENQRLRDRYPKEDEEKRTYTNTIKLVEEVGELCNEVLITGKQQRAEKLEGHGKDNLAHEFADVTITTLLLAQHMGVDIQKALESKIEKINKRY